MAIPEKKKVNSRSWGCFCIKSRQTPETITFSTLHRWTIYLVGLLETLTFGSCLLGWAQLVYVLKNGEVFLDVCDYNTTMLDSTNDMFLNDTAQQDFKFVGCEAQDRKFALIYIIASVSYAGSSIVAGMMIHHCGLVLSRIAASTSIILGFVSLGFTTKDLTLTLYICMILLSIGGCLLRLSGLQFCNLFPKYRSTALTVITGSYAASAGLFLLFQVGESNGLPLMAMCLILAGVAFILLLFTIIMPWHSIPTDEGKVVSSDYPLSKSLFSVSSFTYIFWFTIHVNGFLYYSLYLNTWITAVATNNEEAGFYSSIYSLSSFSCILVTPFPGLLTDFIFRKAALAPSPEERMLREMMSPILPIVLVTLLSISLVVCTIFNNPVSIYVSFAVVISLRASVMAVGLAYLRIRFPAEHFDRLNGIITTIASLMFPVQYPFFVWVQNDYLAAMLSYIGVMVLTFILPLHLLYTPYMKRVVKEKMSAS